MIASPWQSDPASLAESTDSNSSSSTSPNGDESILTPLTTAESLHDIGMLAKPFASVDEICLKVCNLSNGERFSLLYNHVEPPTSFQQHMLMDATENLVLTG